MIEGQIMKPEEAPIKVQVVYYLSRAGQLQQPHLIDVTISPDTNGLYLRDVKQRLTAIRGKGVADSFSWSCKSVATHDDVVLQNAILHRFKNYKDNFIWQDLTDDDRILPLGDGEFVLKGSGLYAGYRAAGKTEYLNGQIDPESTSLSPKQNPVSVSGLIDQKKIDFEAVKRSLDPENDHLQDQTDLAAALSLSLQLIGNPSSHLRRFSKDKSMDLNQQVMNSLSQAKAGPAEECTLDRYDMSSNETFLSEDSSTQNNLGCDSSVTARGFSKSTSSSARTDLVYDLPVAKQCRSKERPISADDGPEIGTDVAAGRQEKPDELPPLKTKFKASVAQELGDNATFMLSPRRLMAVLSTPEKKIGKMLHSSSLRSSTLSNSASTRTAEPMSAMKLSNTATCLSQLRFCSQMSPHATDSRPDSPVRPANTISILVSQSSSATSQSLAISQSPGSARSQSGPWTRWKSGRKSRSSEPKVVSEEPSTPSATQVDSRLTEIRSAAVRRALNSSFEFDMPVDANSSGPGTPVLPTGPTSKTSNESSNPASESGKSIPLLSPRSSGVADMPLGLEIAAAETASAEVVAHISVKEVITERLPGQQSTPAVETNFIGTSVNENIIPPSPRQSKAVGSHIFSMNTASVPRPLPSPIDAYRVSLSDSLPRARPPVSAVQPESPESPMKQNPPCSPIRTNSPPRTNSPAVALTSPGSFNKRTEDGRARARGLVKEVTSKDSKFMKDLARDMERPKLPSNTMRSIVNSKRVSGIKNGTTTIGIKSISSTVNKSPPRISSLLWEEPPLEKGGNTINRDERPLIAGRTSLDWEKTLQEAASLPSPEFGQILQECRQCGRTFKPDSLKVHKRGCHGVRQSQDADIMR